MRPLRRCRTLSYPDIARQIAADGIHILVDLMGHTGVNRLGTVAMRPAPIQVSFLGMLGTTGADFIDYLITDAIVTPPEFAPEFTEKFVTLPSSYMIAELEPQAVAPSVPVARGSLGLPEDGFVYCSFNSTYKVDPETFTLWMRILSQTQGSVLWLYSPGQLVELNLRSEADARGVDPARLIFAPLVPRPEHARRHRCQPLPRQPALQRRRNGQPGLASRAAGLDMPGQHVCLSGRSQPPECGRHSRARRA